MAAFAYDACDLAPKINGRNPPRLAILGVFAARHLCD